MEDIIKKVCTKYAKEADIFDGKTKRKTFSTTPQQD